MTTTTDLYPLTFDPIYKEKVWGGRAFEMLGRQLPGDTSTGIGESWEIADLATTAKSGGGGNAEHSVIANGPLTGQAINQLLAERAEHILGDVPLSPEGGFPLLVKLLDATTNLSVQVHPTPTYLETHAGSFLKSEAWFIIDADPGSVIYVGLQSGINVNDFRQAIQEGNDESFERLLNAIPVKAGQCYYLPSGVCHALGAGVRVAEIQTPSDTTFRLYDWGRTVRELHIPQALSCLESEPASIPSRQDLPYFEADNELWLAGCEHFTITRVRQSELDQRSTPLKARPEVWIVLGHQLVLSTGDGFEPYTTILMPASLGASVQAIGFADFLRIRL